VSPIWCNNEGTNKLEDTQKSANSHRPCHLTFWPQVLCDCKITFIAAPSDKCLLIVEAVATWHLLTLWPWHLTFWLQKSVTRTCHWLSTCQVWWWYIERFYFRVHTHTYSCRRAWVVNNLVKLNFLKWHLFMRYSGGMNGLVDFETSWTRLTLNHDLPTPSRFAASAK